MRASIIRNADLPESEADFELLAGRRQLRYITCFDCKQPFSPVNVKTSLGWAETQISGSCETCFDILFAQSGPAT